MKLLFVLGLFVSISAFAETHRSDLVPVTGLKFPNSRVEGLNPIAVTVRALSPTAVPQGYTELLPFALRSPDQDEAGSCLYMSLTGIAEWWLARLNPRQLRTPDGPIDLSERYMMNIAGIEEAQNGMENWKTDSIYLYNNQPGTVRNVDYRFTKGWYGHDKDGDLVKSEKGAEGAEYGTSYNWIDERDSVRHAELVKLPKFKREVIFADPDSNQWNTGVMPVNIIERIKAAMLKNKAPVHIIYNHMGYWHANIILGFNDEEDTNNCSFVREFMSDMTKQAADLREQAGKTTNPKEKANLLAKAKKTELAMTRAQRASDKQGGCHPKGVFYVRDSIYQDANGPGYDYDPSQTGEEAKYGGTKVVLEYDWVRYLANHAMQITVE